MLVSCANSNSTPHPMQAELEDTIIQFLDTVYQAKLTMDSSLLSTVAAGDMLGTYKTQIERHQDNPNDLVIEETKVVETSVVSYSAQEATIEVKYEYRDFVRNSATGGRDYASWRWRKVRFFLVREDNAWKVYDEEFIDWSG